MPYLFWFWLPPLGYMAAIFVVSSLSHPEVIGGDIPDYFLHALEYFLLALLVIRLLLARPFQGIARSHAPRGNAKSGRSASIAAERHTVRSDAERRNENVTALGGRGDFRAWHRLCLLGVIITIAYGMSDEFHQYFVPNRQCTLSDLLADAVGALLAYGVALPDYLLLTRCRPWLAFLRRCGPLFSVSYAAYLQK